MERVRNNEVDSSLEVCNVANRIIENMNRIEGLVLKCVERMDVNDTYNEEVEEYNDGLLGKGK